MPSKVLQITGKTLAMLIGQYGATTAALDMLFCGLFYTLIMVKLPCSRDSGDPSRLFSTSHPSSTRTQDMVTVRSLGRSQQHCKWAIDRCYS